jgi:O-antigen/teichoic acid export membrane protein
LFQKLRELSKNLAIYGLGDVAVTGVNFLLLPVYMRYLTAEDYGVLTLLGSVEVIAKILFRWGLDGSFMRFYYDCEDSAARQKLASTIFYFLLAVSGVLLLVSLAAAPAIVALLDGSPSTVRALRIVLVNTFAIGFTFLPFHLLRMEQRSKTFSALTLARSVSTLLLRIALVVGLGMGVMGVVLTDIAVTAAILLVLLRFFAPLIRPVFSREVLRESLRFGLPRMPHAFAQQVMAVGDRFILTRFRSLAEIGVYSIGVSFGLTLKLFLSAFEYAWAPFYYATAREPGAERIFAGVTTYGVAILSLMTAGLSAIGSDLLALMAKPDFAAASGIITWTAIGVLLQGVYLLTSIGLNITKNTRYYPVATTAAAVTNVGLNFVLIPRFGIIGAAWANGAAYAVQAVVAFRFSQRVYPVAYEWGRLARVAAAALLAYGCARMLPSMPPALGVLARGGTVVAVFTALLAATGFLRSDELQVLQRFRRPPGDQTVLPADTVELAGDIVATDLPADALADPRGDGRMQKIQ